MIDSNKIVIGNDTITYYDEVLKISNISRTSIVIYENKNYLNAIKQYNDKKQAHEQKQNDLFKYFGIGALITFFLSVIFFSNSIVFGLILLVVSGICGFFAYQAKYINFEYKIPRPFRGNYPERYGLCVNMNSGYRSYFTASKDEGLDALRELQKLINKAGEKSEPIVYQDNRVHIENKDGVINLGDNNEIINERAEGVGSWA